MPNTGTSIFNVLPPKIGPYLLKIECFCFEEQVLSPKELVDMPVSFFIGALGMAIGIGGGSVISRAFGDNNLQKARLTFGNQLVLTFFLCLSFVLGGLYYADLLIPLFGGKGGLFSPSPTTLRRVDFTPNDSSTVFTFADLLSERT